MSQRYIGSSISPTAAPTSSTSTTGVWSINDQYQAKNANNWPLYVPPETTDPYFKYVSMLLPGNGTNGAQNNTFLDSSTNNFTITRNGNTTQGTFTPYYSCWSNYFDGSGDYLTAPNNTTFNIGSNNFTIESWVYPTSIPAQAILFCKTPNSSSYGTFEIRLNTNGTLIVYVSASGGTWDFNFSTTNTVSTNLWNHVALTRTTGGVYTIWINGVSSATYTWNFSMWNSTYPIAIGAYGNGANPLTGYMSNARIVNGTSVYTSAFTPPTAPLTSIANTVLLTCQSNRLIDNSPNNLTITKNGDTSVQKFSPFEPVTVTPASYSGYFDGTGDYLSAANNAAFSVGTDAITVEGWLYVREWKSAGVLSCAYNTNFHVQVAPTSFAGIMYFYIAGTPIYVAPANAPALNTWFHFACVRESGGAAKIYINGVAQATGTLSGNGSTSSTLYIGTASHSLTESFSGDISNLRFVKGTAVYTSNFTPPTAPLTAISGTVLLTCQSSSFIDNSTNAFPLTAVGNAQPIAATPFTPTTSAITPYAAATNGGSAYFDGAGDYLSLASSTSFAFGTGDYTLEFWVYSSIAWSGVICLYNNNAGGYFFQYNTGTGLQTGVAGSSATGTYATTLVSNAWNHIAISRASGSSKCFVNGAQVGSTVSDATNYAQNGAWIGALYSGAQYLTGYISNLRVVKGTAVYKSAFVPPAAPVTAITNTQLLVDATNGGIIDNAEISDLETANNAQISTAQSKFGGSSIYFDGTSARLAARNNISLILATANWTMECWAYLTNITGVRPIVSKGYGNAGGFMWWVQDGNLQIRLYDTAGAAVNVTATGVIATDTWYYLAVTRSGNTVTLYVNGSSAATGTFTSSLTDTSVLEIGTRSAGLSNYIGYIDDFRITKGLARTITTSPTSAFPTA